MWKSCRYPDWCIDLGLSGGKENMCHKNVDVCGCTKMYFNEEGLIRVVYDGSIEMWEISNDIQNTSKRLIKLSDSKGIKDIGKIFFVGFHAIIPTNRLSLKIG